MTRTMQRICRRIKEDATLVHEATRAARLNYVRMMEFDELGNPNWNARRIFSTDALDFFAAVVKLFANVGFGMSRVHAC